MKYWINTVSLDHLQLGIAGNFTQANHGKITGLKRLQKDDWIIFYSPKTSYEHGETLQAFTALAQVVDDTPYQIEMMPGFMPWRRNVSFVECKQLPIRDVLDALSFITDKAHWGYKFRFGLFEIPEVDFKIIQHAMLNT
jgi:hypothetical protein